MLNILLVLLLSYVIYMALALTGITRGYHRYFSHREFETTPTIEIIMLYCGLLCGVRSPLTWAGVHRMHHAYTDTPKDPHSPKHMGKWRVFFSLYRIKSIPRKFIKDLLKNSRVMFFHKYGTSIWWAHVIITFFIFGSIAIWVNFLVVAFSYIGYGVLNTFGHDLEGPVNRLWINAIAPFEGNHEDHHIESKR